MDISKYDGKHVRITDKWGQTFAGMAEYGNRSFLECDKDGQIEVGFSVVPGWQGRGLATEALKKVLEYLTENEGIPCVTAWCADENTGSKRVLEKAGMKLVSEEKDGLVVGDRVYDKLIYEYKAGCPSGAKHMTDSRAWDKILRSSGCENAAEFQMPERDKRDAALRRILKGGGCVCRND